MDFQTHFVVASFMGRYHSSHEGITIEQVVRQDNTVTLHVHVGVPGGHDIESSPYHIIQVAREGAWGEEINFALLFNGRRVVRHSQFIP